jgi:hypothetical protein
VRGNRARTRRPARCATARRAAGRARRLDPPAHAAGAAPAVAGDGHHHDYGDARYRGSGLPRRLRGRARSAPWARQVHQKARLALPRQRRDSAFVNLRDGLLADFGEAEGMNHS